MRIARTHTICVATILATLASSTPADDLSGVSPHGPLQDIIGVTHVAGKYHLTEDDFLNEGADRILELGSRAIKVWFESNPAGSYPYNSDWPQIRSLVDLAKTRYFRELFDKPFSTYILMCFSTGRGAAYFRNGMSEQQKADEQRQFHELAGYLLDTYEGTGKTFVIQHWEGDWLIRGNYDPKTEPTKVAIAGMIDWLNARQAGVSEAMRTARPDRVRIFCAAEVNRVVDSMRHGRANMVNRVLPHTHMDLISYSAWDAATAHHDEPQILRDALDFVAAHAPNSDVFGNKNVYLGEFGMPANSHTPQQVQTAVRNAVETGLDWGCPYIVYWQLYCNELSKGADVRPPVTDNDAVRGFWLIRPDGTKTATWHYFRNLLNQSGSATGPSNTNLAQLLTGANQ